MNKPRSLERREAAHARVRSGRLIQRSAGGFREPHNRPASTRFCFAEVTLYPGGSEPHPNGRRQADFPGWCSQKMRLVQLLDDAAAFGHGFFQLWTLKRPDCVLTLERGTIINTPGQVKHASSDSAPHPSHPLTPVPACG